MFLLFEPVIWLPWYLVEEMMLESPSVMKVSAFLRVDFVGDVFLGTLSPTDAF